MRILIRGKADASSEIQVGYKKIKKTYQEGDVWVEGKKTWTIKNGIKIRRAIKLLKNTNCCPEKLLPSSFAKANIVAKPSAASRPNESGSSIGSRVKLEVTC